MKYRVFQNWITLSCLQFSNFIFPLLLFPYLIRTVGMENFGVIVFAHSISQYLYIVTDYGFGISGTREISKHADDMVEIENIFSRISTVRCFMLLVVFFLFTLLLFIVPLLKKYYFIHLLSFGFVVGQTLLPTWFFHGMQNMKVIGVLTLISKFFIFVCVIILIKETKDYYIYPILESVGTIVVAGGGWLYVKQKYGISFRLVSFKILIDTMKKGWPICLSNVYASFYLMSNPIILGIVSNDNIAVGSYAIAEKSVRAVRYVISPLTQALFPYFGMKFRNETVKNSAKIIINLCYNTLPFLVLISICIFFFSEEIVNILTGSVDYLTVTCVQILAVVPLIGTINNLISNLFLLTKSFDYAYSRIVGTVGIFSTISCILLSSMYEQVGAAATLVLSEILLCSLLIHLTIKVSK